MRCDCHENKCLVCFPPRHTPRHNFDKADAIAMVETLPHNGEYWVTYQGARRFNGDDPGNSTWFVTKAVETGHSNFCHRCRLLKYLKELK